MTSPASLRRREVRLTIRLVPHVLDLGSRKFWQLTGRRVDLEGSERWLDAPVSRSARVSAEWLQAEAARHGGALGPDELVSRLWGRRVEQLALPMRPLDVAHGMDSAITPILDRGHAQVAAAWTRTLRGSGRTVFSGAYSVRTLPGADRPSVHVAFPLESGNVQVFLRPSVVDGGGFLLESPSGRFGEDGAYVVPRPGRDPVADLRRTLAPVGVLQVDDAAQSSADLDPSRQAAATSSTSPEPSRPRRKPSPSSTSSAKWPMRSG